MAKLSQVLKYNFEVLEYFHFLILYTSLPLQFRGKYLLLYIFFKASVTIYFINVLYLCIFCINTLILMMILL